MRGKPFVYKVRAIGQTMKLIVAGASGFIATEVIRQSLSIPKITSIIAIARKPVSTPSNLGKNADSSKLHSVVLNDYSSYPDDVMKQLAGADACIWYVVLVFCVLSDCFRAFASCSCLSLLEEWSQPVCQNKLNSSIRTVAITPTKSRRLEFDQVRRVCHDYTLAGLQALFKAHSEGGSTKPLRFLYMSGSNTERDQTKTPSLMAQYCLMRVSSPIRAMTLVILALLWHAEADDAILGRGRESSPRVRGGAQKRRGRVRGEAGSRYWGGAVSEDNVCHGHEIYSVRAECRLEGIIGRPAPRGHPWLREGTASE